MDCKYLLLAGIVLTSTAFGDTVKLTDQATWNGKVEYKGSDFTLKARFLGGTQRTLHLTREQIETIEINENDYNPGSPPEWLSSDSITGCLIGSPVNKKFLIVPDQQPAAIQVAGNQDFNSSVGHSVILSGTWQVASTSPGTPFQVNSISSLGRRCDDSGDRLVWRKLLEEQSRSQNEQKGQRQIPNKKLGEHGKTPQLCTSLTDAVVLLDDAKHEGCLSEINEMSVSLMSDREFQSKKVRVIVLGK